MYSTCSCHWIGLYRRSSSRTTLCQSDLVRFLESEHVLPLEPHECRAGLRPDHLSRPCRVLTRDVREPTAPVQDILSNSSHSRCVDEVEYILLVLPAGAVACWSSVQSTNGSAPLPYTSGSTVKTHCNPSTALRRSERSTKGACFREQSRRASLTSRLHQSPLSARRRQTLKLAISTRTFYTSPRSSLESSHRTNLHEETADDEDVTDDTSSWDSPNRRGFSSSSASIPSSSSSNSSADMPFTPSLSSPTPSTC